MSETKRQIPSLDGLRGVSILFVLFSHAVGTRFFLTQAQDGPFLYLGEMGVRVFFVLSGFLITTLLLREAKRTGRIDVGRFYFRRVMRIFPAYYTFLGVLALVDALGVIGLGPGDLLRSLSYTSNYFPERSWY